MHKAGKTQTEIAHALGRSQGTVSKWLTTLNDTRDLAKEYLHAKAFRMAENVVKKGQARDHIQALKGIGVLEPDARDINIAVGVSLPGLSLVSVTETAPTYLSPSDTGDNS
jgi:transcriptional regulator with XRE-family HTH domain